MFIFLSLNNVGHAATYYVRTDGGTSSQCNGTADAAYSGSGSNQACAFNHPFWALSSPGSPNKMVGGDTLIIGPGQYMMGLGAPNTPSCSQYYPWDCRMRAVPSGTASNPTRILGKGWNSGCAVKPQLWGTERSATILDLRSSDNVEIQCLDITDHSSCMESGPDPATKCNRDTYPYGPWAMMGIAASDSTNVLLKNLSIHGLRTGILAGRISDWTIENTSINTNSFVGWDGDIGVGVSSNSGKIIFKNTKIMYSGCGETYPSLQPHHCYSQDQGGYGDGLGTHKTGGDWVFDHVDFSYNISDGLDLLYHNGDGSIKITHSRFEGNAGNQVKVAASTTIDNSKVIGNCAFFNGKSIISKTGVSFTPVNFNNCRAAGNSIAINFHPGMTFAIYNSTVTGNGDVLVQTSGTACLSSDKVISKNNIYVGGAEFNNGGEDVADLYYAAGAGGNGDGSCGKVPFLSANDIIWGTKNNQTKCQGNSSKCVDPKISGPLTSGLENQNISLKSGSPAINAGLVVEGIPTTDFNNNERGGQWDVGAVEFNSVPKDDETTSSPTNPSSGSDGNPTTTPVCGNSIVEAGEQCDGSVLGGKTCESLGYSGGSLACSSSCLVNVFGCVSSLCGNGVVNSGEQCDGNKFAGKTCVNQGFIGGPLECSDSCTIDTSGCFKDLCGNGLINAGEQCDGKNSLGAKTCVTFGFTAGTLACSDSCKIDTSECANDLCGNGLINAGEQCDGKNSLGAKTCVSEGFTGGTLECSDSCRIDTSGCAKESCGNGVLNSGEQCDGSNLGGKTCVTQGFKSGTLDCNNSCVFDTSDCIKDLCGNGLINAGEQCDGKNSLGAKSCVTYGFSAGTLACSDSCKIDTSACDKDLCGNGVINSGEQCDGSSLGGKTCANQGFDSGTLDCHESCALDTSGCVKDLCGNGVVNSGEQCDGANLSGKTCVTQGFSAGILGCSNSCVLVTSGCTNNVCGNGVVNSGEQCDGGNLAGKTCTSLGFAAGTLDCNNCSFDTSNCTNDVCGNGVVNSGEQCDGNNLAGKSCKSLGFAAGTLDCSNCSFDTSACTNDVCGNGIINADEQCDGGNLGGQSCASLGQGSGSLSCSSACQFNISGCSKCGNGNLDPNEQCDGGNLAGRSCVSLGYVSGDLGCTSSCMFNTSSCNSCGDGIVNVSEQCDGGNLAGNSCVALGFKAGVLGCTGNCKFNTVACTNVAIPVCGNNVKDIEEQCDGTDFGGQTCQSIGYSRGNLACTSYCQFNVLGCR